MSKKTVRPTRSHAPKVTEHCLANVQARAVLALARQRDEVIQQANRAVVELSEALADLALTYAARAGLPGGRAYNFEQREGRIFVVEVVQAAAPVPGEAPGGEVVESQPAA